MSYKCNELISAQGKNFEILKAFLNALGDAGGDEAILNDYLNDPNLQTKLARQIVGGPWKLVGSPKTVLVDWSFPFGDLAGTEGLTKGDSKESMFKTSYRQFLPAHSPDRPLTNVLYELIPLPLRMNYKSFTEWVAKNASILAVDRELMAYTSSHVDCQCEIMALGSQSESGCFPRFSFHRNQGGSKYSWWGIDSEDPDKTAIYGTVFVLVRSKK